MIRTSSELFSLFARAGVAYRCVRHAPTATVAESAEIAIPLEGARTKNLVLTGKNAPLTLLTAAAERRVDLKSLARAAGVPRFSFAKPELLPERLGVEAGSVTPLALVNDEARSVRFLFDHDLMGAARIIVHPMRNDMSVALRPLDLHRFLERFWGGAMIVQSL